MEIPPKRSFKQQKKRNLFLLNFLQPTLLRHSNQPIHKHRPGSIKCNIRKHDAEIPPAISIHRTHTPEKIIRAFDDTETAIRGRGLVREVTACYHHIWFHVGAAIGSGGWVEM